MKCTLQKNTSQDGFTLLEVIVTMGLFIVVLLIASKAFEKIVTLSSKYSKMEESNIEGIIGLEVMRHDLGQMGFGLPWGFSQGNASPPTDLIDSTISYSESVDTLGLLLNDAQGGVPRAFAAFAAIGSFSSDYIGLKGTTMGISKTAQRWTYIPYHSYSTSTGLISLPVSYSASNPQLGDKVIFVNSNVNDITNKDHRLIVSPGAPTAFSTSFSSSANAISSNYLPISDQNTYMVYGVDPATARMPFNRADFFVSYSSVGGKTPPFCAPLTGVLYKATVNQADGKYTYIPLLDCIADMQVVLGWDLSDAGMVGTVNAYSSLPNQSGGTVTATPGTAAVTIQNFLKQDTTSDPDGKIRAQYLREHLKVVKVYILAQEGKRDPNYKSPITSITVGDLSADGFKTKADYGLSTVQQQYRWKLYRIVVRPKNLVSNQR